MIKGRSCCRVLKKVRREAPEEGEKIRLTGVDFSKGDRKCKGPEKRVERLKC